MCSKINGRLSLAEYLPTQKCGIFVQTYINMKFTKTRLKKSYSKMDAMFNRRVRDKCKVKSGN